MKSDAFIKSSMHEPGQYELTYDHWKDTWGLLASDFHVQVRVIQLQTFQKRIIALIPRSLEDIQQDTWYHMYVGGLLLYTLTRKKWYEHQHAREKWEERKRGRGRERKLEKRKTKERDEKARRQESTEREEIERKKRKTGEIKREQNTEIEKEKRR